MKKRILLLLIISILATIIIFSINKKTIKPYFLSTTNFLSLNELKKNIINNNDIKKEIQKSKVLIIPINTKILVNAYNNKELGKQVAELDELIIKINENIRRTYILFFDDSEQRLNFYFNRTFDKVCKIKNCIYEVK